MYDVYIRFIDGTSMRFRAREVDINVGRAPSRMPAGLTPGGFGKLVTWMPTTSTCASRRRPGGCYAPAKP